MAYKLTQQEKEVANFLRSLNKNIENAYTSLGADSEIYKNLTSFVGQIKAPILTTTTKPYLQVSQSKKALQSIIPNIKEIKGRYYMDDKKTIKSFLSTGTQKEISTRVMKNQHKKGNKVTLKEAYKLKTSNNLIAEMYNNFKESIHTNEDYENVYHIMERFREDTISTSDVNTLKEISQKEVVTQQHTTINPKTNEIETHEYYIDTSTGEIVQDINLNGEWIDIL